MGKARPRRGRSAVAGSLLLTLLLLPSRVLAEDLEWKTRPVLTVEQAVADHSGQVICVAGAAMSEIDEGGRTFTARLQSPAGLKMAVRGRLTDSRRPRVLSVILVCGRKIAPFVLQAEVWSQPGQPAP